MLGEPLTVRITYSPRSRAFPWAAKADVFNHETIGPTKDGVVIACAQDVMRWLSGQDGTAPAAVVFVVEAG